MITLFLRSIIIFLVLLAVVRLMGKRQIGNMQPFELVITIILAELAAIPMADNSIPIYYGIVPVVSIFIVHFILTKLSNVSIGFSNFVSGNSMIVIDTKGINARVLKALDMSVYNLLELLRGSGYFDISEIAYAILETNGKISVFLKSDNEGDASGNTGNSDNGSSTDSTTATTTPIKMNSPNKANNKNKSEDMNRKNNVPASMLVNLVVDGKVSKANLSQLNVTEDDLNKILAENKINSIKNVLLLTKSLDGKTVLQTKNGGLKVV